MLNDENGNISRLSSDVLSSYVHGIRFSIITIFAQYLNVIDELICCGTPYLLDSDIMNIILGLIATENLALRLQKKDRKKRYRYCS